MNESMNMCDILQEIKKSLNFVYGIHSDCIDDELLKLPLIVTIERVIFNAPATIVFWLDGSKTVVKAQNGEPFDIRKRGWPWRSARSSAATVARTMIFLRNGVMKRLPWKKVLKDEPAV